MVRLAFNQCFDTGNGRFPDNHFPGQTFPGQLRALTRRLFPVQDVSRTICINNFEYFGMLCSKINDELSCAPCTYDYMLLTIFFVCIIIFLSLLCQFVSHLYFT